MRKGLFSITCAALIAAASATPSWSQTIAGSATTPRYAKEIFNGGANPTLNLNGKTVTVSYPQTQGILAAREANITFTLSAGTFADPPNLLAFSDGSSTSKVSITSSGGVGSSSVTYQVRTTANLITSAASLFTFTVPRITGVGSVLGASTPANPVVSVGVAVAPAVAGQPGGFPMFPTMTTSADDRKHDIASSGYSLIVNPAALTPSPGATSTVQVIDITDRTSISGGTSLSGLPMGSRAEGISLSTVQIGRDTAPVREDGSTQFLEDTTNGNLIVTVEGPISDGDILFFSTDTTYAVAEALSVSGRTATLRLPLLHTPGNALDNVVRTLYYVPAMGMLSQSTFEVSYELDLTLEDNKYASRTLTPGPTALTISGIEDVAYAYAIPPPTAGDVGNLRIRCQGEAACDVFLDCRDADGDRIGNGDLAELKIPGYTLMHFSSKTTLPRALGVSSWEGRISCNVMSNKDISVQLLVRSGDTLVNNTYISGLEPNPGP